MNVVPEKVLSWLYSVLHEYRESKRAYSDVAQALSATPTLGSRTEVYTYENGSHALLVTLSGTIPVDFRGTTYRFPVKLWIPQSYPQEPPIAYVQPGRDMLVRPGQHVGVDGRIYHPYLRDWSQMWDRANIAEFVGLLQSVFAKEPPVINSAQQQQYQQPMRTVPQTPSSGGGPPQLPPKERTGTSSRAEPRDANAPPPRPPKPGEESSSSHPQRISSRDIARDGPPPPPLPHELPSNQSSISHQQHMAHHASPTPHPNLRLSSPTQMHMNGSAPGPPPGWQQASQMAHQPSTFERSPVSPISPPPPTNGHSVHHDSVYANGAPTAPSQQLPPQHGSQSMPPQYQNTYAQTAQVQQPPYPAQQRPQQQQQQRQPFAMQAQPPPKQPPPDLLSDPFDVTLPSQSSNPTPQPAPPIPPNPEKEHLLQALTTTLATHAQQKINQNLSFLAPLHAQHSALQAAHARLQSDLHTLQRLDSALGSNEAILRQSIADCDATIAAAGQKPPPPVDEVLVAPTLVANQLWTLCAEEAAAREAMYVLQKAVDRGRVGGPEFVKQMRSLGRERFLKMALARKCARGLGLEVPGGHVGVAGGGGMMR